MNKRTLVGVIVATTALLAAAFPAGATTPEGPATQPLKSASVTPTSVQAGSAGAAFTLTYGTGDRPFRGTVRTVIPAGWSAPQTTNASGAGYLSLSLGTCQRGALGAITGTGPWTVTVDGVTCRQGTSFTLRYGNVQAPTTAGPAELTTTSAFAGSPVFSGVEAQPVVTVLAGPARSLAVAGHPASTTAGTAQSFTVTGVDQYGNTNAPVDGTVAFSSSDPSATLPSPSPVPGGSASFSATLVTAGTQSITAARTADPSVNGTQSGIVVEPAALASITLSPSSATVPAGVAQSYSAEGFDIYGNSRGAVTPTLSISPDGTCDAVSCTATTAGAHTVTGTVDGISDTASLTVVADEVASLSVSGFPTTTTAGTPADVTVTALDQYGNVVTDYDGTVAVTSSDPQADLPAEGSLGNGTGTFSVELRTAGTHSITATDTEMPAVTGTQSGINVSAGPLADLHLDPSTASLMAGQSQAFTATGTDAYGNPLGTQSPVYSVSPTGTCVDNTCEFRVPGVQTVTGTVGSVTGTAAVTVTENTVVVQPETVPDAVDGEAYSAQFSATGTVGSAAFFDVYGELPPGLALSSTGALTGTPTTVGVYTFDVRATDENGVRGIRRYTVRVSPAVVIDRGAVTFGDVAVTASETEVVTITNQGSTPVVLGSRGTTNPAHFAAVDDTCFTLDPLEPGESCTSGVRFAPQGEGAHSGRISWHFSRESDGRTFSAGTDLAGVGVPPLAIDRTAIGFGNVPVTASATETITITNNGGTAVVLNSRGTTNPAHFAAADDTCFTLDPLAPGESCTSGVRFAPQSEGAHVGRISWHFSREGSGTTVSVGADLTGTGISQLAIDRTAIGFGEVPVTGSVTEQVTITNNGGTAVVLNSRGTTNPAHFAAADDACFTLDPLAPGESCTSGVRFAPQGEGAHAGRISWHFSREGTGATVSVGADLTGTGIAQLAIDRTAIGFGDVPVTGSVTEQITITNNGGTAVVLNSRGTTNPTHFAAADDACFTLDPLAPGESCTSGVRFAPQGEGAHAGRISWHFSREGTGATVSVGADLFGNGVAPLAIDRTAVGFGDVPVTSSATEVVTITNRGGTALVLNSRGTTNPTHFAAADDACFTLDPLAPGESCTSGVRFAPQGEGVHTGRIVWHFSREGTGATVSVGADLFGTGVAPLAIDRTAVGFGDVPVTSSATEVVTITNRGGTAFVLGSRATTNPAHFATADDACFTLDPLEPGESCTSGIRFAPQSEGAHTGRISWHFSRQGDGATVSVGADLTGTGVPQLSINRTAVGFGEVPVTGSETEPVTITNHGGTAVVLGSRATTNPAHFATADDACFTLDPLEPGESCTSGIRFAPQSEGAHTGRISWHFSRQGDGANVSVGTDLAGLGVGQLAISATAIDFGSVPETGELVQAVTITNRGGTAVVLGSRATTNPAHFTTADDACFTLDPLGPGESCTSGVRFRPQAQGPLAGRISWHFSREGDGTTLSVGADLTGTGIAQLAISATAIPFGNMVVGGTITESVIITNRGGGDVVLGSRATTNPAHFGAVNDACFTLEPLGPGESCTVDVRFRPQSEGTHTGRIAWHYSREPGGTSLSVGVDVSGIGSAQLGTAASAVGFGEVPVTASSVRQLSITNHGDTAVVLGSRATTNPAHFAAVDDGCFTLDPLEPGESCTSGVRFAPQSEGAHTGRISWHFNRQSDGATLSIGVDLTGTGVSQLAISQAAIGFGNVAVGESAVVAVTVTNRGGTPLQLGSRATTNPAHFTTVDDGCFTLEPLAPGASCTSGVRFQPQATGPHTGRVSWHFTRSGSGASVSTGVDLSGTGI